MVAGLLCWKLVTSMDECLDKHRPMHIYILGICGTLMGSIALLARELGHKVTGTDQNVYPPMSTQLEGAGITLTSPYTAENIPRDADLIIIGNAGLPRGNPAVEAVLNGNIPYTSGAEWLGRYLLHDRWVIAVAGTHGKTTTTSMISWILSSVGMEPGFLIGGVPLNFGVSSRSGSAPFFVIEADEYDTSYFDRRSKFLHYQPKTLVLNNLEFDHADIFDDLDTIKMQFHLLLRTVPSNGQVIHPHDDRNLAEVLEAGCWTPTLALGSDDLRAELISDDGRQFQVLANGQVKGEVHWPMTGTHNVANGLAAVAAARHTGIPLKVACEALCEFQGVKRRMEVIHSDKNLIIYDDFAHHPTAIAMTLEGLRRQVGNDTVLAVIEPASHTMRQGIHQQILGPCTASASSVIWFDTTATTWDMSKLENASTTVLDNTDSIIEQVIQQVQAASSKVHLVIMSNSSFEGLHLKLRDRLTATGT